MFKVDRRLVFTAVGLSVALYLSLVFSLSFGSPYQEAKRFITSNDETVRTLGKVKWIWPSLFGNVHKGNSEAHYDLSVYGENDVGHVHIRLANVGDGWKVLSAGIVTRDNRIIALRQEGQ